MSWRNIIKYADGTESVHKHTTNEHDAKGWNQTLAREKHAEVRLEHVNDGPYNYDGTVTHIQTTNGNRSVNPKKKT